MKKEAFNYKQNRKNVLAIVETIILIGRQEIFLRGHRDSGRILELLELLTYNDGNFRSLLRFHVSSGGNILNDHLSRIEEMP